MVRRLNEGREFLAKKGIHPEQEGNEFGNIVADYLGEVFGGLYRLPEANFHGDRKSEWYSPLGVCVMLGNRELSTYDYDLLTRLVFLSFDFGLRCAVVNGSNKEGTKLIITPHTPPPLETTLDRYRSLYPVPTSE